MNNFKCNNCGATYRDSQVDGSLYCHVCPPLAEDAGAERFRSWNPRDERLTPHYGGRFYGIMSEGKGVTCLDNPKISEPAWITAFKQQEAKLEASDDA